MTSQSKYLNDQRILSHGYKDETLEQTVEAIKERIRRTGDKPHVSVEKQLMIVDELADCPYGQFLLKNQGLDGYWADYMICHPYTGRISGRDPQGRHFTEIEKTLFDKCPSFLATQERSVHFTNIIQKYVRDGVVLASLPCGFMRDLLSLDFSGIDNFRLIGIDIDPNMLNGAKELAEQYNLSAKVDFSQEDAWNLPFENQFNLLASNGLNIYEPDDNKVTQLYHQFFKSLAPGGLLVTSFLTPPLDIDSQSERDIDRIDQNNLLQENIIFADILNSKWRCFRSSSTTKLQLETAGFDEINFVYDNARVFPTVVAHKPK
ncbi:MAG: class I SAM-dependent methyltransferase [Nostoc sp.]|uniref:class I SAM-dependent methyltransferase n=1 Tax=Nostoc sp. TaxID=1180 RepID=UPI002FF930EE